MGAQQLAFEIYKVDEDATRAAVEKYLKQAREYMVTEYIPAEPTVTAAYSDMPRAVTGITSDSTGRIACVNVDEPERRRRHIERAERAVKRLRGRQEALIRAKYMDNDDLLDYEVALDIGMSDRTYRRQKSFAIYRLASSLGLLVLEE